MALTVFAAYTCFYVAELTLSLTLTLTLTLTLPLTLTRCFYVAEGVLHVSGVLAVVSMGAGLGATFWPLICSKETMQGVWHIFEW